MTKRAGISKKIRFEVMKRDSFKCQYCGRSAPDVVLVIDHIHPVADGGENDITNLITSCFDCNAGKSDRKLSDNTAMAKRKKQLDELQERREQIELMAAWQIELMDIDEKAVDEICILWGRITKNHGSLSDSGKQFVKRLIKKYGLAEVMECLQISANQYLRFIDGVPDPSSAEKTLTYIEKILRNKKAILENPYLGDLYYIRGILANRHGQWLKADYKVMNLLEKAYKSGVGIERIKELAISAKNWTAFKYFLEEAINEQAPHD